MSDLAIEMLDVGKRFGGHWALAHIHLGVRRGESVAIFGGNGSGKSTLLKVIATLLSASVGKLKVLGHDGGNEKSDIRQRLRFLPHEKQLYGSLTVLENLKLVAQLRGLSGRGPVEEAMARLQIERIGTRRVSQLSEGLKKRVVLARLLMGRIEPELFLLDEPHPTLDEEGREILDRLIREWREKGKTVLLASHDHDRTLPYVDRVIWLEGGRIRNDGPADSRTFP